MALIRWKPTRDIASWTPMADLSTDLFSMQDEMNRMFDRFFNRRGNDNDEMLSTWYPNVDIVEKSDSYVIKADLPGVLKDDVKITVRENLLTIHGEKKQEKEEKNKTAYRTERVYGSFERSFTLPSAVKDDKIQANFKDGVLTIEIPKAEEAKAKEIQVKLA